MTIDTVSDMLTRLRNASLAKNNFTFVPYSKKNIAILKIFLNEGYILSYLADLKAKRKLSEISKKRRMIHIQLKYNGWWIKKPTFVLIKRISRPGKRLYFPYKEFNLKVRDLNDDIGLAVLSTSKGIVSHHTAIAFKKGGEMICYIK